VAAFRCQGLTRQRGHIRAAAPQNACPRTSRPGVPYAGSRALPTCRSGEPGDARQSIFGAHVRCTRSSADRQICTSHSRADTARRASPVAPLARRLNVRTRLLHFVPTRCRVDIGTSDRRTRRRSRHRYGSRSTNRQRVRAPVQGHSPGVPHPYQPRRIRQTSMRVADQQRRRRGRRVRSSRPSTRCPQGRFRRASSRQSAFRQVACDPPDVTASPATASQTSINYRDHERADCPFRSPPRTRKRPSALRPSVSGARVRSARSLPLRTTRIGSLASIVLSRQGFGGSTVVASYVQRVRRGASPGDGVFVPVSPVCPLTRPNRMTVSPASAPDVELAERSIGRRRGRFVHADRLPVPVAIMHTEVPFGAPVCSSRCDIRCAGYGASLNSDSGVTVLAVKVCGQHGCWLAMLV
jgi:hypothetical protein